LLFTNNQIFIFCGRKKKEFLALQRVSSKESGYSDIRTDSDNNINGCSYCNSIESRSICHRASLE
jgi:hypothetical protein